MLQIQVPWLQIQSSPQSRALLIPNPLWFCPGLPVCCYDEALTKTNLGRQRFIWLAVSRGSRNLVPVTVAKTLRNIPCGLFCMACSACTTLYNPGPPRIGATHCGLGFHMLSLFIKRIPRRRAHGTFWCRPMLSWESLFPDMCRFCVELTRTSQRVSSCYRKAWPLGHRQLWRNVTQCYKPGPGWESWCDVIT